MCRQTLAATCLALAIAATAACSLADDKPDPSKVVIVVGLSRGMPTTVRDPMTRALQGMNIGGGFNAVVSEKGGDPVKQAADAGAASVLYVEVVDRVLKDMKMSFYEIRVSCTLSRYPGAPNRQWLKSAPTVLQGKGFQFAPMGLPAKSDCEEVAGQIAEMLPKALIAAFTDCQPKAANLVAAEKTLAVTVTNTSPGRLVSYEISVPIGKAAQTYSFNEALEPGQKKDHTISLPADAAAGEVKWQKTSISKASFEPAADPPKPGPAAPPPPGPAPKPPVPATPAPPTATSPAGPPPSTQPADAGAKDVSLARTYLAGGLKDKAKTILESVIAAYPNTPAADEAKELLDSIK